jgi:hypothetical protein
VIDDGSTDNTNEILKKFRNQISIISQRNEGVVNALNRGIERSSGKYIARLDADDVSEKNRLEVQVDFLEHNLEIGILGSRSILIDSHNKNWGIQNIPLFDENIRWTSFFRSPFINSSVMFRKKCIALNNVIYRKEFAPAEDYDLWVRLLRITKGANLALPLVRYRVHDSNLTTTKRRIMIEVSKRISSESLRAFLPNVKEYLRPKDIEEIQELLFTSTKKYNGLQPTRCQTILNYLKLWEGFSKEFQLSQEKYIAIQNQVIIRACQMAFFPPLADNLKELVQNLYRLSRKWPLTFLSSIPVGLSSFIRERFFWKFS